MEEISMEKGKAITNQVVRPANITLSPSELFKKLLLFCAIPALLVVLGLTLTNRWGLIWIVAAFFVIVPLVITLWYVYKTVRDG